MSYKYKSLGELCVIEKGKVGIQKAIPGEFTLVVTAEERLSHSEYHFEGNAVVIPLVSSTGHGHKSLKRIHFQTGKFAVGNILCAVLPKDETVLNAEYLYRFLDLNREKELVGRMKGMANVSLPLKEIAQIEIPLPPVSEQIKFVEEYKQLEIGKNKLDTELAHQLDMVKQLRQAFLREAMQGKLTADWRASNPELVSGPNSASQLLITIKTEKAKSDKKSKPVLPIKPEEIPFDVPENWLWCKLGELFEIVRGSSPRPKGDPRYFSKLRTEFHWITIADFAKHSKLNILKDTNQFLTEEGSKHSRKVTPNDLLVASSGVGSVGKSSELGITGFIYDGLMAIKNIPNQTIISYLAFYLKVKELEIYSIATGANWLNINTELLNNYILPLPPLLEQERIVTKLDELMQYCDQLEESIKTSQRQNEMLLQQVLREALEPKENVMS